MTQDTAAQAKQDLHQLTVQIIRLRQILDHETENRDQLLSRLYGLERDAAALRRALQTTTNEKEPTLCNGELPK